MRLTNFSIIAGILVIIALLPIWLLAYPPLTDYPSHLMSMFITQEHANPAYGFAEYFVVHWRALPNLGSEALVHVFAEFVPVPVAGRIYLSLITILYIVGGTYLIRGFDRRNTVLGIFLFVFVFNWYFNQGYLNFWGSIPVAYIALGYWLRHSALRSVSQLIAFTGLCLLVYFFHFVSWGLLGLVIGILVLGDRARWKHFWRTALAFVPSVVLFGYYYFGMGAGSTTSGGIVFDSLTSNMTSALIRSFVLFTRPGIAVYLIPMAILVALFLVGSVRYRSMQTRDQRWTIAAIALLIVLYFVLPLQISSVWPVNLRVNQLLFVLIVCAIPHQLIRKIQKPIVVVGVACALLVIGYIWQGYAKMSRNIETYVSGIEYIEPRSTILPLTLNPSSGWQTGGPLSTVWAYYHLEKGGAGPYLFDLAHGQIVNYKRPKREMFPAPSLYPNRPREYDPAKHAAYYDYVLLWGTDAKLERNIEQDFSLIFRNGALQVFEKERR